MRQQIVDCYGTRPSEGHIPPSSKKILSSMGRLFWLLRHYPRTGPDPYLPRGIYLPMRRQIMNYYSTRSSDGTSSLSPKKEFFFVHETTIVRVPRCSIFGRDKVPIPKDLVTQEMTIHRLLRTRFSEDSKLLEGTLLPQSDNSSTTIVLDQKETSSQLKDSSHEKTCPLLRLSTKRIQPSTRQEKPRPLFEWLWDKISFS